MKEQIICRDRYGTEHSVMREKLQFRIGVCAVLQDSKRIFLFKDAFTKQLEFPGGEVKLGESLKEALIRECREETGITIQVGRLLTYRESFFYIARKQRGYQALRLFFSANQIINEKREQKKTITGDYYDPASLTTSNTNEVTYSVLKELFLSDT